MTVGYDEFARWYAEGGGGSGPGSGPGATAEWRRLVEGMLPEVDIVIDVGCGDWQHSELIDWGRVRYVGIDVVPDLITKLQEKYGGPLREFRLLDPDVGCAALTGLLTDISPSGRVLTICKDVLQHLSNDESKLLVDAVMNVSHSILLVNDSTGEDSNIDIEVGGCRHMDPRLPPHNLEAAEVLRMCGEQKAAFLIKGGADGP